MPGPAGLTSRLGFTRRETGAILLLAAGLLGGTILRLTGVTGDEPPDAAPLFDYAASDSLFRALADTDAHGAPGPRHASQRKPPPPPGAIDINSATRTELMRLPGIGEATACRIIEERTRGGAFGRVEDILRVRGIGPKKLAALRRYVTVR